MNHNVYGWIISKNENLSGCWINPLIEELPEGWERIEYLCYPGKNSKAFKHKQKSYNVHIVNMYDTGKFTVNAEYPNAEWIDETVYSYSEAVELALKCMNGEITP